MDKVVESQILVIGSGGREHCLGIIHKLRDTFSQAGEHAGPLAWKLAQSEKVFRVFVSPGNYGTGKLPKTVNVPNLNVTNFQDVTKFCKQQNIGFVVVGPEVPLAEGISDFLAKNNIACFGPSADAAKIEASKKYAKEFMIRNFIPTARFRSFNDADAACKHITECDYKAYVVKASGLAAGKGVIVANSAEESCCAAKKILDDKAFGVAGDELIVEELLGGVEFSALCFTDGEDISLMPLSQDHKRLCEGDTGPNTGGMGAYAPYPIDENLEVWIKENILAKTIRCLRQEGIIYRGVLYAGLMLTKDGPKVLEFNCRFGDPETQAILPLLESDLYEIMHSCVNGTLKYQDIAWKTKGSSINYVTHLVNLVAEGLESVNRLKLLMSGLDCVRDSGHSAN